MNGKKITLRSLAEVTQIAAMRMERRNENEILESPGWRLSWKYGAHSDLLYGSRTSMQRNMRRKFPVKTIAGRLERSGNEK